MIIQHNIAASNTNRMLDINTNKQTKATEKLSSGYRINKAADDAAGLAISEKMRGQIRGLTNASSNSQTGISLIQTAEGAMQEVLDMLHRGKELSVQAANDTLTDEDRQCIQLEIDQLQSEISRIRKSTTFNEMHVFGGDVVITSGPLPDFIANTTTSFEHNGYQDEFTVISSTEINRTTADPLYEWHGYGVNLDFSTIDASNVHELYNTGFCTTCNTCSAFTNILFTDSTKNSSYPIDYIGKEDLQLLHLTDSINNSLVLEVGIHGLTTGEEIVAAVLNAAAEQFESRTDWQPGEAVLTNKGRDFYDYLGTYGRGHKVYLACEDGFPSHLVAFSYDSSSPSTSSGIGDKAVRNGIFGKYTSELTYEDTRIQTGSNSGNELRIILPNICDKALGIYKYNCLTNSWKKAVDVTTIDKASNSIAVFDESTEHVYSERSKLGAYQNRLEHTIVNLNNNAENTQSAESLLRDADIAKEMIDNASSSVLAGFGQEMLSTTNKSKETILSLLK